MPSHRQELYRALAATVFFGAAGGIVAAIFNNYLADVHHLDASMRGWLELPRELPGFLMMFVAGAMLILFRETQMAALAMLFTAAGTVGLAYFSPTIAWLTVFTIIWSLGDHVIFTVEGPIGLKLARSGAEGRRLGQFGGARNLGTILGVGAVFVLAKLIGDRYGVFFSLAAACALIAGVCYWGLHIGKGDERRSRILIKKKYGLFYLISALFGIRKQIFLVFGAWVLVKLHGVSVETIALLYFIGAAAGIVFRPLMGEVIDWMGERRVLALEEIVLAGVCVAYAFASDLLPQPWDLYLLFFTYVLDNVLFALRVARTTYLKKIADHPSDITPTLSMGTTLDHLVAMTLPILSGYLWVTVGYRWVFVLAALIAVFGYFVCLRIRIPQKAQEAPAP